MIEGQRSVPDMMCKFIFLLEVLWYGYFIIWDGSENCFGRPTMTLTLGNGQGLNKIWIFFDTFCDAGFCEQVIVLTRENNFQEHRPNRWLSARKTYNSIANAL